MQKPDRYLKSVGFYVIQILRFILFRSAGAYFFSGHCFCKYLALSGLGFTKHYNMLCVISIEKIPDAKLRRNGKYIQRSFWNSEFEKLGFQKTNVYTTLHDSQTYTTH